MTRDDSAIPLARGVRRRMCGAPELHDCSPDRVHVAAGPREHPASAGEQRPLRPSAGTASRSSARHRASARWFRSRSRRRPGPRAAGRLDAHLVVAPPAQQRARERRVHADVASRRVDLVRARRCADSRSLPARRRPAARMRRRRPGRVVRRPVHDHDARRAACAGTARGGRSRAAASCRRCTRRSPSGRPARPPRPPRG